jgi:probable HAF family extracellular repeat protein
MQDLGTLGGNYSSARAINARGQIVGASLTAFPFRYLSAFLWTRKKGMTALGTFDGPFPSSHAEDVNARGQVVGAANLHGFVWDVRDGMRDLGTLGGYYSVGIAINNSGVIVGSSTLNEDFPTHAVLWQRDRGNSVVPK